jgi:ribonucleotide reductase alpha subunit
MQTRASNSNAHPGTKALEALRVRRSKEVIQKEKNEKQAKQDESEAKRITKEVRKEEGKKFVALLETKVAAEAAEDKSRYPRHQVETETSKRTLQCPALALIDTSLTYMCIRQGKQFGKKCQRTCESQSSGQKT